MRLFVHTLFVLAALVPLTGCRVGVSVFDGGNVLSATGEHNCFEGRNCEFTVDDPLFTETFIAEPRHGFAFTKWRAGNGFLCGNSTNPECTVSFDGVPQAQAQAIAAADTMVYLVPEFTCVGHCPERVDGIERGLDEALVAMYDAKKVIEAYVKTNGGYGASHPGMYGINLGTTGSTMLRDLDIYPQNASSPNHVNFYIVANVFRHVWGDTENPWEVSSFALSGETNADNTMRWHCVATGPGNTDPDERIPTAWLPAFCRL